MHEFSICQNLVNSVLTELEKQKPNTPVLLKTKVAIGQLRQIVPENLEFAYGALIKDTEAEGSQLEINIIPAVGKCKKCGRENKFKGILFECEFCGSHDAEIVHGMELYLRSLEIKDYE